MMVDFDLDLYNQMKFASIHTMQLHPVYYDEVWRWMRALDGKLSPHIFYLEEEIEELDMSLPMEDRLECVQEYGYQVVANFVNDFYMGEWEES